MTRDWNISACRWAATCCIVACHIMQYYENCLAYWFNIGVQVFFIISGYLYCNKQVSQPLRFLTRNWLKILIPCEIFLIGTLFAFYVVGVDLPPTKECIRVVLLSQTIPGCGHLWFISQILFCYLSIPVLHGVRIEMSECGKARYVVIVSAIIAVICCICIGYRTHVRADCFVCFIVGFFLCDYNKRFASIDKTFIKLLFFAGGLAFIVRIILMLNGCLDGDIYILDMWLKAAVAMALFLFFVHYCKFTDNWLLRYSDQCSYYIYLTHHIWILGPLSVMGHPYGAGMFLALLLTVISSFLLKLISSKILSYFRRWL